MGRVAHPPHLANTALTNFPPIRPNFSNIMFPAFSLPRCKAESCILNIFSDQELLCTPSEIAFKNGVEL